MGNSISTDKNHEESDIWWPPPYNEARTVDSQHENVVELNTEQNEEISVLSAPSTSSILTETCTNEDENYEDFRRKRREQKIQQFRSELEKKHLARRQAIAERSKEILFLREELMKYKKENEKLKDKLKEQVYSLMNDDNLETDDSEMQRLKTENDKLQDKIWKLKEDLNKSREISQQNSELRKSIAETQKDLQNVNKQVLEFENERQDYQSHVVALKDVIKISKRLLEIKENQLQELKTKVTQIETSFKERELTLMSTDLKVEYERQLENIRGLRALYVQRQAATIAERDLMASQLTDAKNNLEHEQKKNSEMQERVTELENNVSDKYDQIKSLESQLGLAKAEYRGLEAEMSVINQLFSQILFGFNNCKDIDLDKLIKLLEENHDLLTNIVTNEESEEISSALPKVLLDLVNQINEGNKITESEATNIENNSVTISNTEGALLPTIPEENLDQQSSNTINSAEKIVNKLPKVWRVLIELLRQQSGQLPVDIVDGTNPCYKSVETPKGPKLVLSVSKTFIRLKDLILEKKSLEKEMTRLKQLNTHLEVRLQDQEKRLETVQSELSKTWHVVGRMQKQHQQLHTHEKVLRYELAQKRKMLTEIKEELEYCREKWQQAREKNSNTEEEWKKLRNEFASRKATVVDELNNSAESGYSDEREGSSDEESTYILEKRNRKNNKINKTEGLNSSAHTSDTDDNENGGVKIAPELCEDSTVTEPEITNNSGDGLLHFTIEKTDSEVQNINKIKKQTSLDAIDNVEPLTFNSDLEIGCSSSFSLIEAPSETGSSTLISEIDLQSTQTALDVINNVQVLAFNPNLEIGCSTPLSLTDPPLETEFSTSLSLTEPKSAKTALYAIDNVEPLIFNPNLETESSTPLLLTDPSLETECSTSLSLTETQSTKTSLDAIDNVEALIFNSYLEIGYNTPLSLTDPPLETECSTSLSLTEPQSAKTSLDAIDNVEALIFNSNLETGCSTSLSLTDPQLEIECNNSLSMTETNSTKTSLDAIDNVEALIFNSNLETGCSTSLSLTDPQLQIECSNSLSMTETNSTKEASLDTIDNVEALIFNSNLETGCSTSLSLTDPQLEIECSNSLSMTETNSTKEASLDTIDNVEALIFNSNLETGRSTSLSLTDSQLEIECSNSLSMTETNSTKASLDTIDNVEVLIFNSNLETRCSTSLSITDQPLESAVMPSTSQATICEQQEVEDKTEQKSMSFEERLARREARLKRLEEQSEQLVKKVTNTTNRSTEIYNRLDALHEQYSNNTSRQETNQQIDNSNDDNNTN